MIGVRQGRLGNFPGGVPGQLMLIEQAPHEFGNGQRRMRIVELDGDLGRKVIKAVMAFEVRLDNVVQRTGYQKILLDQT